MAKHKILILNKISSHGLKRLPGEDFEVSGELSEPDAVMLRSFDMHTMDIPASVQAVAREIGRAHV